MFERYSPLHLLEVIHPTQSERYRYDAQGRIAQQDVLAAGHSQPQTTRWHYAGTCLVQLEHPTQSERYRCDAAGRRTERVVVVHGGAGQARKSTDHGTDIQAVTRYRYDDTGTLVATQLPDGSTVHQRRDGLGRLSEVRRQRIATPWLAAFAPEQTLLHEASHDMRGLAQYSAGNGMQTQWQRSSHPESFGTLARLVHRKPTAQQARVAQRQGPHLARSPQELIELLLGVRPAHAQAVDPPPQAGVNPQGALPGENLPGALPGALGLPNEPQALIDQRYLWAGSGELLLSQGTRLGTAEQHAHAFDPRGQLVASVRSQRAGEAAAKNSTWAEQAVWRHAYDAQQRRVLAQQGNSGQGVASQSETAATERSAFEGDSARLTLPEQSAYNANGQPERWGQRSYVWDALGRLSHVRQGDQELARYTYDHRGLRVAKVAGEGPDQKTIHTLYSEDHSPQAELDAQGRVQRLYLWLSPQDTGLASALPLAVVDRDTPSALIAVEPSLWQHITQAGRDALLLVRLWVGSATDSEAGEHTAWLHSNHLGAPELATDRQGQLIWQARYSPFGAAQVQQAKEGSEAAFVLHLRLPGQIFDPETGLHYNRQRYYDPQAGQYLTPDPLGNPDGPNPYAYVAFNPLTFIDPNGLILFAFDGTGNSNHQTTLNELGNGLSNVWQFFQLYDDGNRRYVTGVGTRHRETDAQFGGDIHWSWGNTSTVDMGANYTGPDRIARMVAYFNAEAELFTDNSRLMDVDIIGFSRGAAQARDFANRINAATRNGQYSYTVTRNGRQEQRCQMINFRFMGLWDTVLSTNLSGTGYNLGIVAGFQHVAQAVALNEYRGNTFRRLPGSTGAFPLESIMRGAVPVGQTRIERGFVGAHADIGGGFGGETNALPLVALSWMIEQARDAGVNMLNPLSDIAASTVIHDKSDNQYCLNGPGCSEDREVRGGAGGTQRRMTGTGMTYADTRQFIRYDAPGMNADGSVTREPGQNDRTGTVDMARYLQWLRSNGYELGNLRVQ